MAGGRRSHSSRADTRIPGGSECQTRNNPSYQELDWVRTRGGLGNADTNGREEKIHTGGDWTSKIQTRGRANHGMSQAHTTIIIPTRNGRRLTSWPPIIGTSHHRPFAPALRCDGPSTSHKPFVGVDSMRRCFSAPQLEMAALWSVPEY